MCSLDAIISVVLKQKEKGMLVLTRKIGESITIGDNIRIKVLDLNGAQVRLGAEAPREISVHRDEIYQRVREQKSQKQSDK